MAKIQDIDIPHLEFAEAAAPSTPASGIVRLYAKTDGSLYQKDDAGAETVLAGGGSAPTTNIIVDMASVRSTAGTVTLNSTNWLEIAAETGGPGTGTWDMDFTGCQAGDILVVSMSFFLASAAVYALFDMQTIVSGSPVNFVGGGSGAGSGEGVSAWYGITSREDPRGGSVPYTIQSGDLSAGALKVRPVFRTASATNRSMVVSSSTPLQIFGIVYRP